MRSMWAGIAPFYPRGGTTTRVGSRPLREGVRRGGLKVRRGRRLDAAVGELDRLVQRLAGAGAQPEDNTANPFTVRESERPMTNSGP
jgi:hypothetical protein